MSRQFWTEALAWATNSGTAVANTTSETIIFPDVTVPANFMQDGRILHIQAQGQHSTTGAPTLTFRLRWGGVAGTVLAVSPTITCGSGVTANCWEIDLLVQCRSNGASGTLVAMGSVDVNGATAFQQIISAGGSATPAATSVDLTADKALSLTATWGTASASNTLTGWNYVITALN